MADEIVTDAPVTDAPVTDERQKMLARLELARAAAAKSREEKAASKPTAKSAAPNVTVSSENNIIYGETDTDDKDDKIEIKKGILEGLLERIEKLENPGVQTRAKRTKFHIGHLRTYEDKLVIKIGSAREDKAVSADSPLRITIPLTLVDEDGVTSEVKAPYLTFLEDAGRVSVKFKKFDKGMRNEIDERKGGGGYGTRAAIDREGRYTDALTGEEIAFEVGYTDVTVVVEVTDPDSTFFGQEFTFTGNGINALNA